MQCNKAIKSGLKLIEPYMLLQDQNSQNDPLLVEVVCASASDKQNTTASVIAWEQDSPVKSTDAHQAENSMSTLFKCTKGTCDFETKSQHRLNLHIKGNNGVA